MPKLFSKNSTDTTDKKSKKLLPYILLPVIVILLAVSAWHIAPFAPKLAPAEQAALAIDDLIKLDSLTFHSDVVLNINNEEVSLGSIDGQINGQNLHIWGSAMGSDLNIYQIGSTTYRQDTISEQWLTTTDGELLNNHALLSEANPRAFFYLAQITNATEGETAAIGDEKCRCISFAPTTKDGYWEKYFDNISCTLWINRQNQICRSQITAATTTAGQTSKLVLTCDFSAQNDTPTINAPVVEPAA